MEVIQIHDMLNINEDKDILKLMKNEKVYYSDEINKINHYGMSQKRSIILTDIALYNMKKKELKRRMPYKDILGITFSNSSNEFVIHGNNEEYDYHYNSYDKNLIISLITFFYDELNNAKLKLCEVPDKSVKNFVTGKKEKQKDSSYTKMDLNYVINTEEFQDQNMECLFFGSDNIFNQGGNDINNVNNNHSNHSNQSNYNSSVKSDNSEHNFFNINFFGDKEKNETMTIFSKKSEQNVSLNDFKILKVIGKGTFGKVCLVEYKKTKELYAMKILKKDVLLEYNQVKCTLLEKKILQNLNYTFLVGMVFCFQTQLRIYFVMNFIRGGELFQHLHNCKTFPEDKAKFYAAIIGLALEYLHTHGIVYRDIKPQNILIDEDGYLKLADFGMAKLLEKQEKAFSFCGTQGYYAPEIITGEGHNRAADWWSFGVLLYEMLFGILPFYASNIEKMFDLITKGNVKFPKIVPVSPEAKDLIKKLLTKNQDLRLGAKNGFEDIKNHPFFNGFDFEALEQRKIKPPFKPELNGSTDVTNFDSQITSEDIVNSALSQESIDFIKINSQQFEEF